jgi:hypothetical protein
VYSVSGRTRESDVQYVLDLIAVDVDVDLNTVTVVGNRLTTNVPFQAFSIEGAAVIDGHFCFTSNHAGTGRKFFAYSFDETDFTQEDLFTASEEFYGPSVVALETGFIASAGYRDATVTYFSYTAAGGFVDEFTFDLSTFNSNVLLTDSYAIATGFDLATSTMYTAFIDPDFTAASIAAAQLDVVEQEWTLIDTVTEASFAHAFPFGVYDGVVVYPNFDYDMAYSARLVDGEFELQPGVLSINSSGYTFVVPYKEDAGR